MQNMMSQYPSTSEHTTESKIGVRVWSNNMQNDLQCINFLLFFCSFLATGDSYKGLAACYQMGESKIHEVINETCEALWIVL